MKAHIVKSLTKFLVLHKLMVLIFILQNDIPNKVHISQSILTQKNLMWGNNGINKSIRGKIY
jgi:hypothetical protein